MIYTSDTLCTLQFLLEMQNYFTEMQYFFDEYLQAVNSILMEKAYKFFKQCSQIGLYIDIADSYLIIRITGLDGKHKQCTTY